MAKKTDSTERDPDKPIYCPGDFGEDEPEDTRPTWGQTLPDRVIYLAAGVMIGLGVAFFGAMLR